MEVGFTAGVNTDGKAPGQTGFNPAAVDYVPPYRNHRCVTDMTAAEESGHFGFSGASKPYAIIHNIKSGPLVPDERYSNSTVFNRQHCPGPGKGNPPDPQSGDKQNPTDIQIPR